MPLPNLPPLVSDPGSLIPPDSPNFGSQATQEAWWYFKQWHGQWWQNGWINLVFIEGDNSPYANF